MGGQREEKSFEEEGAVCCVHCGCFPPPTRSPEVGQGDYHSWLQRYVRVPGEETVEEKPTMHRTSLKGKKKNFLGSPPAAFCFDLIGQKRLAWPPLAAREAGKSGSEFSGWAEHWTYCPWFS